MSHLHRRQMREMCWAAAQAVVVLSVACHICTAQIGSNLNGTSIALAKSPASVSADIGNSALGFFTLPPCRVADTRAIGGSGLTGAFGPPSLLSGVTRSFPILAGGCNVPANAQAYSLNITVVPQEPLAYLTVWPTEGVAPAVSTLNSLTGRVVANAAIVSAGTNGAISILAYGNTDVIIDINGYFAPPGAPQTLAFYPMPPCRIADTRNANGAFGGPELGAQQTRSFPVPSSSCGIPETAQAYSLNMTVVPSGPLAYLNVWPDGQSQPSVSTLNDITGAIIANAAIVGAGNNGAVDVFAYNASNLIIDINGYFAAPGGSGALYLYSLSPCRVADTRAGNGFSGAFGPPSLVAQVERDFPIPASSCGVPATAQAYSLNMTVAPPGPLNYLTTWATGQNQPLVSTLNDLTGDIVANAAIVPAGAAGSIGVFAYDYTDLLVDINGYFAPLSNGDSGSGAPVSDTFSSATLSSEWTFVNPQNDGSYFLNGSSISLSVPAGIAHDVWTTGDYGVRIMQSIGDADFEVEVKFGSAVDINTPYQEQGIIVEQDPANFLRFSMHSNQLQIEVFAADISGSNANTFVDQEMVGGADTYMRLKRTGNTWLFSYSYDSYHWTPGFSIYQPFQATSIGPYVGNSQYNGQPAPAYTAIVDYFINRASPPPVVDGNAYPPAPAPPAISIWYGNNQTFGQPGVPQQWVNILGNVSDFNEIATLSYSLNGGAQSPLSMGEDTYRLVDAGDFNAEIDYASLIPGANIIEITATDYLGLTSTQSVTVNYPAGQSWPLPYSISTWPPKVQSVAQIVDGLWQAQGDGTVRTTQVGYDRLLDIGDRVTWQNYLITAQVTMHYLDPLSAAFGIAVGWQGHSSVEYGQTLTIQPRIGHPFPAYFEYSANYPGPPDLYIWTNTTTVIETPLATEVRTLQLETTYNFKCEVQQNNSGGSHFSFKVWPATEGEPAAWDLEADGELSKGSVLLAAYRADVSFGQVTVTGL